MGIHWIETLPIVGPVIGAVSKTKNAYDNSGDWSVGVGPWGISHSPNGNTSLGTRSGGFLSGVKKSIDEMAQRAKETPPDPTYSSAYNNQGLAIQNMLGGLQGDYNNRLAALGHMFNLGEDPNAAAARDWALQNLAAQRDAAQQAIGTAYQGGIDASKAASAESLALGAAQGQALANVFNAGANSVQASNDQLAQNVAATAGGLGVTGPVQGDAVDVGAALAAAAPREQALAQAIGQIGANTQNAFGTSMVGQRAAEQGSMQRAAAAMAGDIASKYAQREAERIAQERAAYRAAQMDLANQMAQRQQSLQEALINSRLDSEKAFVDDKRYREQALASMFSQGLATQIAGDTTGKYSAYIDNLLNHLGR